MLGSKGSSKKKLKRKSKSEVQSSANKRERVVVPTDSESEDAFFDEDTEGVTDLVKIEVTKVEGLLRSFIVQNYLGIFTNVSICI